MKCLTIKAPWSWTISHGPKRIENRGWARPFRGELAIHAGKGWDLDGEFSPLVQRVWQDVGNGGSLVVDFPGGRGSVVAVADLAGICGEGVPGYDLDVPCDCGPWAARGQYHWRLANVRPLAEPVPCKGALGLWTLPDEVEAAVVAQLGEQVSARG